MTRNRTVLIRNIYHMLAYAFQALQQPTFQEIATEPFAHAEDLFAAILSRGVGQQLKQGLYRTYRDQRGDLTTLRGKLDLTGTIRHKIAHRQFLACEYDELTENNLYNQILKATARLLLGSSQVSERYKHALKKELLYFSDIDPVDPDSIPWSELRFHRNNQTYRMLIGVCRLILENMLLTEQHGEQKLLSIEDSQAMCQLYERFLREYYRQEFPQLKVAASQIPWSLDDGVDTLLPVMQSDIMLTHQNKVLILDAKYYTKTMQEQYGVHTLRSAHLYQIFAYVKNEERRWTGTPRTVSGMLLYARTNEDTQPDQTYQMSGNRIDVKTLDLNRNFSDIRDQLDGIASDFFQITKDDVFCKG